MFYVDFDKSKNLLKLRIEHDFNEQEAKQWLEQIEASLDNVQPGFKILTDLRDVRTIDESTVQYIDHVMDLCNQKGVSKVVRVIPNSSKDIGFNIMSIFHYSHGIPIITCPTMVEALNRVFPKQECV